MKNVKKSKTKNNNSNNKFIIKKNITKIIKTQNKQLDKA